MAFVDKDGVIYSDEKRTVLLRCPYNYDGYFNVPQSVTTINEHAFMFCKNLTSIHLPDGLLFIEESLFLGCESLHKITIPNGVISIELAAFKNCINLEEVNMPDNTAEEVAVLSKIEDCAFQYCKKIKDLKIPEEVTTIGAGAFAGCDSLQRLVLPSTIQKIGENAIEDGDPIESIDNFFRKTPPKPLSSLKEIIVPIGHKQRFLEMFGEYSIDLSPLIIEK